MSVFRINKTRDYTVISNHHLRDKKLSLKSKGLLTVLLSLPDNWDYSVNGLVAISKEGKDGITSALKELEEMGYLKRTQSKDDSGKFKGYDYDVYEKPFPENPSTGKPITEKPPQSNTKESNTKESNTKEIRHKYGEYSHVLLSDTEKQKLFSEYGEETTLKAIKYLDEYIETSGKKYKNHYLVMKKWVFDAVKKKPNVKKTSFSNFHERDYDMEDLERRLLGG